MDHDDGVYESYHDRGMTPGPIAVNSATFVGIRIAGLPGGGCGNLGDVFSHLVSLYRYWHTYIGVTVAALRWEVF